MSRLPACLCLLAVASALAEEPAPRARLAAEWRAGEERLPAPVKRVAFLGADAAIAFDAAGRVWRFDPRGGPITRSTRAAWDGLRCVAPTIDGSVAIVGLADGGVARWDLASGATELASEGHASVVACAAASPDGRLVATGS